MAAHFQGHLRTFHVVSSCKQTSVLSCGLRYKQPGVMFSTAHLLKICESQYQSVPGNISKHTASNIWVGMKATHSTKILKHCSLRFIFILLSNLHVGFWNGYFPSNLQPNFICISHLFHTCVDSTILQICRMNGIGVSNP